MLSAPGFVPFGGSHSTLSPSAVLKRYLPPILLTVMPEPIESANVIGSGSPSSLEMYPRSIRRGVGIEFQPDCLE